MDNKPGLIIRCILNIGFIGFILDRLMGLVEKRFKKRPAMPLLELKEVTNRLGFNGSRMEVLRNINLQIEEGESVAIVGHSSAGKNPSEPF